MCVCVCERERERERERACVCVCVCVCERERERERARVCVCVQALILSSLLQRICTEHKCFNYKHLRNYVQLKVTSVCLLAFISEYLNPKFPAKELILQNVLLNDNISVSIRV
jgi:hypothetical protein